MCPPQDRVHSAHAGTVSVAPSRHRDSTRELTQTTGNSLHNRESIMKTWQEAMLNTLIAHFEAEENVLGLVLFGSFSKPEFSTDTWSDLDVLVVVKDNRIERFFPATRWLDHFGRLYTYSQSSDGFTWTTRACFENFNRVDFVITTEGKLSETSKWQGIPFCSGVKVLFSRSRVLDEVTAQHYDRPRLPPVTSEQFLDLVRDFRFKSMLAVYKVVRGDLLIALHLTQDLVRDCCVLGMMLRDRATGTNIHQHGGVGNQLVAQLETTQNPFTPIGILDSIKESNEVFERMAGEWSDSYEEHRGPLLNWIEQAKAEIRE